MSVIDAAEKVVEMQHYMIARMNERRIEPRDDIMSDLVQATYDGERPLTDHEIASIVDNMYVGGNETTTFTLASGLWLMLRDPAVYDALRADPEGFQLLLTDFNMPGMSGLEVAKAALEINPHLPVAVASGYITDELQAEAKAAGVREVVFKTDAVEAFCEVVARLVRSEPA